MKRDLNFGALPIARDEYLSQMVSFLQPLLSKGFWSIYSDARKKASQEHRKHERFMVFQEFVKDIPYWSSLIVDEETQRITEKVDCLSELITAIFVGNVKILASIRLKGNTKNIKIKIPSPQNFIHTCYINCAKRVYYNPILFDHKCTPMESERNMDQLYGYIEKGIIESIQQMIPIKSILDEYLSGIFDDDIDTPDKKEESEGDDSQEDDETLYGDQIGSDTEEDSEGDLDIPLDSQRKHRYNGVVREHPSSLLDFKTNPLDATKAIAPPTMGQFRESDNDEQDSDNDQDQNDDEDQDSDNDQNDDEIGSEDSNDQDQNDDDEVGSEDDDQNDKNEENGARENGGETYVPEGETKPQPFVSPPIRPQLGATSPQSGTPPPSQGVPLGGGFPKFGGDNFGGNGGYPQFKGFG